MPDLNKAGLTDAFDDDLLDDEELADSLQDSARIRETVQPAPALEGENDEWEYEEDETYVTLDLGKPGMHHVLTTECAISVRTCFVTECFSC